MEFKFTEEQDQLRDAARDFLARSASVAHSRSMIDDPRGFTEESWGSIVELGWPGLLVPEHFGGLGLGMVDLVPVPEEMGRVPFAGPYLSSAVVATRAATLLGLDQQLVSLADGSTRGAIAIDEEGHGNVVDRVLCRASPKTGSWRSTASNLWWSTGIPRIGCSSPPACSRAWARFWWRSRENEDSPKAFRFGTAPASWPASTGAASRPNRLVSRGTTPPSGVESSTTVAWPCTRSSLV